MKIKQRTADGPYYVHFTGPNGKRMRLSTETSDATAAQLKALEIMRAHLVDTMPDDMRAEHASLETLGSLLRDCWSRRWKDHKGSQHQRLMVGKIARDVGHWPVGAVTYERLETWLNGLTTGTKNPKPLSNATKNRYVSAIHTALTEARKRNPKIEVPHLPHWPENNVRERYMTEAEEVRTISWFDAHVAPGDVGGQYMRHLFITLLDTGMRASEALVELNEGRLLARPKGGAAVHLPHGTTKSGKGRVVPLTARAEASVRAMLASPMHGQLDAQNAGKRWRLIMAKVGIDGVTLHTLRHTCASRLVQRGVDLYVVMTWLGHSSMVITQRYAHFAPDTLTAALTALEVPQVANVPPHLEPYPVQEAHPASFGTQNGNFLRLVK